MDHTTRQAKPSKPTFSFIWATARWIVFAGLCVTPIFFSLGNHPIHGDSEARYGVVARGMAQGDAPLLVPHYFDQPHLTKPPLTYWLMAGSIRLLGDSELALRMPAALAGVLTLGVIFGLAFKLHGPRRAALATGLAAVMPMFVVISRMGITDGPLCFFMTSALAAGLLAAREERRRWVVLLWGMTALGLLTKGPAALLSPGAILVWLACTRQWSAMRRVRPVWGLLLSALPLIGWGLYVAWQSPEAWAVWRYQTLDRATGEGDHPEAWWFFIPVLILGLLPATALLNRDGFAKPFTTVMNEVQNRGEGLLWALMIAMTFGVFTAITGKLMSYLMPIVGPMAWLAAAETDRRLAINNCKSIVNKILPATLRLLPLLLVACGTLAAGVWLNANFGRSSIIQLWPMAVFLGAATVVALSTHLWTPGSRLRGAAAVWLAMLLIAIQAERAEDRILGQGSVPQLVDAIARHTGQPHPHIMTVGLIDRSLPYYTHHPTERINPMAYAEEAEEEPTSNLVILAEPTRWAKLDERTEGQLTAQYQQLPVKLHYGYERQELHAYRIKSPHDTPAKR